MNWKFWKRDDDYYGEPPRPPTRRTTLAELSERIIARQMRADAEYGLLMAERIKKVAPPGNNAKTLVEQLEELKETKELLKALNDGESSSTLKTVAEVIAVLPQVLETMRQQAPPQQYVVERPQPLPQPSPRVVTTSPEPESEKRQAEEVPVISTLTEPEPEKPPTAVSLSEFLPFIDMEPPDVIEELKAQEKQDWLELLAKCTLEQIEQLLNPYLEHEEHGATVRMLLDERREWLEQLIELAKKEQTHP